MNHATHQAKGSRNLNASKPLTVIDLFSGVGGPSYGFAHDRRFQVVAANEILHPMATAYNLNHPAVKMYDSDIRELTAKQVRHDLGSNAIDIIIGGPPCQAYSTIGKRLLDDPRGKLFQEYFRLLREFTPRLFILENVRGLLSMAGGEVIRT
jgi:DNA (cytosine-5)-methyltransferase 1